MKKLVQMLLLAVILSVSANLIAAEKYAIVIGGEDTSDSKYLKPGTIWNDTYLMWEELVYEKGYKDENVFVLFRDGRDQYSWDFQHIDKRYNPDFQHKIKKITDYAATKENLELVIEKLKTECTKDDFLFVWTHDLNSLIADADLTSNTNDIKAKKKFSKEKK